MGQTLGVRIARGSSLKFFLRKWFGRLRYTFTWVFVLLLFGTPIEIGSLDVSTALRRIDVRPAHAHAAPPPPPRAAAGPKRPRAAPRGRIYKPHRTKRPVYKAYRAKRPKVLPYPPPPPPPAVVAPAYPDYGYVRNGTRAQCLSWALKCEDGLSRSCRDFGNGCNRSFSRTSCRQAFYDCERGFGAACRDFRTLCLD